MVNSWEEEEADSDEDLAELEAQLYSQIYYEATDQCVSSSKPPEFNVSDYIANDIGQSSASQGGQIGHLDSSSGLDGMDKENLDIIENNNINSNQSDGQDDDEESRYSSFKVLEPNPFYSEPESSEDEGIIDSSKVNEKSTSKTTAGSSHENDEEKAFSSDSEGDDDDDEGIIVLPAPPRDSPDVINIEDEEMQSESEVLEEVYEVKSRKKLSQNTESQKRKNSAQKIQQILGKGRKGKYKEDYGSDFDDNFLSDEDHDDDEDDEEVDDSEISLGNLMGSKDLTRSGGKRKVSELLSAELNEVQAKEVEKPAIWTSGMERFYNKVDEQLMDIDLDRVLDNMSQDPKKWTVDRCDIYGGGTERARYFGGGKRCHNCNQFGHQVRDCPEPVKAVKCPVCGGEGHRENRCPERCCLRCGQPSFSFQESCSHCQRLNREECKECHKRGHIARDCPDYWRRFHMSTLSTKVVRPRSRSQKANKDCWCCNCGSQGHLQEVCHRPRYSKYPPTSLKVVSYAQPKVLGGEEREEGSPKPKKKKMSKSCPNSPHPSSSTTLTDFSSQPASPISNFPSFLMDLEVDEEKNIGRKIKTKRKNKDDIFGVSFERTENKKDLKKMSKKKLAKERKRALIGDKLEEGKSRAEILEDVMQSDNKKKTRKNAQEVKKLKHLIRDCDQRRMAERVAEFQEKRGFKSNNFQEKGVIRREDWEGGQEGLVSKRQSKREEKVTRAALIPTSVQAACKFLKKEAQKVTGESSDMGKRLKKDLKQEIFGLKHGLHAAPRLKKVERKRLADLVINLRNHA